jgi:hypothetical protein
VVLGLRWFTRMVDSAYAMQNAQMVTAISIAGQIDSMECCFLDSVGLTGGVSSRFSVIEFVQDAAAAFQSLRKHTALAKQMSNNRTQRKSINARNLPVSLLPIVAKNHPMLLCPLVGN